MNWKDMILQGDTYFLIFVVMRDSMGLYSQAIEFVENGGVPAKVEDLAFHGLTPYMRCD